MNKSAIQKYAIWARNELRDQIAKRGYYFGIDADGINVDGKDETCVYARDGRLLTDTERKQRNELFRLVKEKGFDQVVEEVSYTWFNRLIALRFMEVNDYLPEHIRVLSNANNEFKPEIKTRALDLEDPHFDKKKIMDLIDKNDDEELYRYLLLTECNALNDILPQMFEKIGGYTELLLPNNLLKADSVIGKLVSDIDEADWDVKSEGGQVQIIGWLYQYYNQELKDQTFNDLKKKNKKISKERIPAATQLFTPDWIVHYMVENSLGRMWIEGHPNDELKSTWKYYLDEAEQEPEVEEQLKEIRKEYSKLNPQDIKFLDPAMGSGHILVVAFDTLMQIYESQGIRPREAAKSILENNLYGLDIDDRAAQLAYFAVMMKAREYDRRIFSRGIQPNLYSIQESNGIDDSLIDYVAGEDKKLHSNLKTLVKEMKDAKEYGSIITISELNFNRLEERLNELRSASDLLGIEAVDKITPLVKVGRLIAQKYEIVCTNPPYMSISNGTVKLIDYISKKYPNSNIDLYTAFIERAQIWNAPSGISSLITQHGWMFLSSFQKFRDSYLDSSITQFIHLGAKAFDDINGEVVQTVAFISLKEKISGYKGTYFRLIAPKSSTEKENCYLNRKGCYIFKQDQIAEIPGKPFAYWLEYPLIKNFDGLSLKDVAKPRQGLATGDNERFLRYWTEIDFSDIGFNIQNRKEALSSNKKWFPCNKGGGYCKWYGNNDYVVDWYQDGLEIRNNYGPNGKLRSRPQNIDYYFKEGMTWSTIANDFSMRFSPSGFIFETKGSVCFPNDPTKIYYLLALMNSSVARKYLEVLSPTLDFHEGPLGNIPILYDMENETKIEDLSKECIDIAKAIWDSGETSWEFSFHPLMSFNDQDKLSQLVDDYLHKRCEQRILINKNQEEINKKFCHLYGMDYLVPYEDSHDIRSDLNGKELITSLVSYFVGLLFGRYSVSCPGIYFAGGDKSLLKMNEIIDQDNVIPIGEDEYFEDDLTSKFITLLSYVYGKATLEENLQFISERLGGTGTPREIIRKYFLNDFYNDHCKMYKKRPIYWLFDSGKKNGFKCLIYMHRYTPDTLARIRTDYVHEQQERYRSQIKHIQETIDTVPKSEQVKMKKELKDLEAKSKEVAVFEEKLHHLADQMIDIDLDDGVKHNYALFQDVLAKIK